MGVSLTLIQLGHAHTVTEKRPNQPKYVKNVGGHTVGVMVCYISQSMLSTFCNGKAAMLIPY